MSTATPQRVVVVGSSFAGLTAALELRKRLDERHEVVVLDPREHFTFIPSLIWLPFGVRDSRRRHVPARPALRAQGHPLRQRGRREIDPEAHVVTTAAARSSPTTAC